MGTVIELDSSRQVVLEPAFGYSGSGASIEIPSKGNQLLYKWGDGSWTLSPINKQDWFVKYGLFDAWDDSGGLTHPLPNGQVVKFRLADVVHAPDWWEEYPEQDRTIPGDGRRRKFDFYLHAIVKAGNIDLSGGDVLANLRLVGGIKNFAVQLLQQQIEVGVGLLQSAQSMPANQGYMLKFWAPQHFSGQGSSDLLLFAFGDFAVKLSSDGTAQLLNTIDFVNYKTVGRTFQWRDTVALEEGFSVLTIFPHSGKKIEVLCENSPVEASWLPGIIPGHVSTEPPWKYHQVIDLPYEPPRDANGTPIITQPGPWTISASRSYLPRLQVSKLIFYNGSDKRAEIYDGQVPIKAGAPRAPLTLTTRDFIPPGCQLSADLRDGSHPLFTSGNPFISNGTQKAFIFHMAMRGIGDIQAQPPFGQVASSITPEFYGYDIRKPFIGGFDNRTPLSVPTLSQHIDYANAPENERLTVVLDNSDGQLNRFANRPHIPLTLFDDETAEVYFEGYAIAVKVHLAPSSGNSQIEIEARGMADKLLRCYPSQLDFTADGRGNGDPWKWQDALVECFETAGIHGDTQVKFEDFGSVKASDWNIRLWAEGDKGGKTSAGGGTADPHVTDQRWCPSPKAPIYGFMSNLIEDIFGWHWMWDRYAVDEAKNPARRFSIFKRPRPGTTQKLAPKVRFYASEEDMFTNDPGDGIPARCHQRLFIDLKRPEVTTLIVKAEGVEIGLDKASLAAEYGRDMSENDALQPLLVPKSVVKSIVFDNPNGYISPDHPHADPEGIDYLGDKVTREVEALDSPNDECTKFLGVRSFEDVAFGYAIADFTSGWDDVSIRSMRKWDVAEIQDNLANEPFRMTRYLMQSVEPAWTNDRVMMAHYRYSQERADAPPPR